MAKLNVPQTSETADPSRTFGLSTDAVVAPSPSEAAPKTVPVAMQPSAAALHLTQAPALTSALAQGLAPGVTKTPVAVPNTGFALAVVGRDLTNAATHEHWQAIRDTGIGTHAGEWSDYFSTVIEKNGKETRVQTSTAVRQAYIDKLKTPGTHPALPVRASCIDWALEQIGALYKATGKAVRWAEIRSIVVRNQALGTVLAKELQKDGWQGVFFALDSQHPYASGKDVQKELGDVARARTQHTYYGVRVDHLALDFAPTAGAGTRQNLVGYAKLAQIPFGFVVMQRGDHVGLLTDTHPEDATQKGPFFNNSNRPHGPEDPDVIKVDPLADSGYLSGLIMVPPGTWVSDEVVSPLLDEVRQQLVPPEIPAEVRAFVDQRNREMNERRLPQNQDGMPTPKS